MSKNPVIKAKQFYRDNTFRPSKFQYSEKDATEARSKPIIRCSSKYLDFADREKLWRRNDDSGQKNHNGNTLQKNKSADYLFKFKQNTQQDKDVSGDQRQFSLCNSLYRPVSSHKFRDLQKEKWVGSSFKVY